ncbi:MAG: GreA/GreB family elongation factor [bacterium]
MSEPSIEFRHHLHQHQFELLEEDWLALLESDCPADEMLDLAELAARYAPASIAVTLLKVLADWFADKSDHRRELKVLRRLLELNDDHPELPARFANCFRRVHADSTEIVERLLQRAGLGFGARLADALVTVDGYLKLLPGTVVIDAEIGPARVTELDLLLNRAMIATTDGRETSLDLTAALSRVRPVEPDGFFELLLTDPATLRTRAEQSPGRVAREFLQDLKRPMSVQAIRKQVTEIIPDDSWEGFWNRARRELENDPHIRKVARPTRGYEWSDLPLDKEPGRSDPSRERNLGVETGRLARMSRSELVRKYAEQKTLASRRQLIELVAAERAEDAPDILADLFCAGRDNRARSLIEELLRSSPNDAWQRLLTRVLTSYRQFPDAFAWVAANASRLAGTEPRAVLTRLLDLLESRDYRSQATALRKVLIADNYRLIAASLASLTLEAAGRLLARVGRLAGVEDYRQDEIAMLVYAHHPDLKSMAPTNATLTTEAGFSRARADLERLTGEELPRAADELAAARAHGDLSENYEYKAAKEKQARLMGQIQRLQASLARVRVIQPGDVDTSRVSVGCRVRVVDDSGKAAEYEILGPWDSDPDRGVISYLAPLSNAMLGRHAGESFEFDNRFFTVLDVTLAPALGGQESGETDAPARGSTVADGAE